MVLASSAGSCFASGGDGCGTRASRPCGVVGEITMKIMMSTSRISINGTTFISETTPLDPPTDIAICKLLYCRAESSALTRSKGRKLLSGGRRRRLPGCLELLGKQAEVIHARRPDFVH